MERNIYLSEIQNYIGLMSKINFSKIIEKYFNESTKFYPYLEVLYKYLLNFKDDSEYKIEGVKGTFDIEVSNNGKYLDLDIYSESINIRIDFTEFYYFVDQISVKEFEVLLFELFKGNYNLVSSTHKNLIVKQDLIFDNIELTNFNQVDIYGKEKDIEIYTKRGFNWFDEKMI